MNPSNLQTPNKTCVSCCFLFPTRMHRECNSKQLHLCTLQAHLFKRPLLWYMAPFLFIFWYEQKSKFCVASEINIQTNTPYDSFPPLTLLPSLAVALVKWLVRLPSAQTIRGSNPGGGAEKENLFPCCFPVLRRAL